MTYEPVRGVLILHERITLRVHYQIEEKLSDVLLSDTALDAVAAQTIYNYEDIVEYYQGTETPRQTYDYVIITTSCSCNNFNRFFKLENPRWL